MEQQTYTSLIDSFKTLALSHILVKSFRVGDISSIEQPDTTDSTPNSFEYTAVHLVPGQVSCNGRTSVFDFDMIVFDLCKDDLVLQQTVQSQCLEITRDFVSYFNKSTWGEYRFSIQVPYSSTLFTESFVNSVAGCTTQIRVEAFTPLGRAQCAGGTGFNI